MRRLKAVKKPVPKKIDSFDFQEGRVLAGKYEILSKVGEGWEGEVYLVSELQTDIERAVKFFFPDKNLKNRTLKFYAQKLHKLRHCSILIQYHTQETMRFRGSPVSFLVSEFVEGKLLSEFLSRQPGKHLTPFQGLHLLHSLASGIEDVHRMREYHGDIHAGNIIVERYGLGFDLKLVDLFRWKSVTKPENMHDDICDIVRVFYEAIGGRERYAKQPEVVKSICLGLKRSLITKKFRTAARLREYLENLDWEM